MAVATTKNLTILGIITIVQALLSAATAIFDGDVATVPDWNTLVTGVLAGIGLILAKGASTTGAQSIGGKPLEG